MVKVYARLIFKGIKTIDDVLDSLKENVIAELQKQGYGVTSE